MSSANLTGQPAALTAAQAAAQLGDAVAVYLDGGAAPGGVASSIVDATDGGLRPDDIAARGRIVALCTVKRDLEPQVGQDARIAAVSSRVKLSESGIATPLLQRSIQQPIRLAPQRSKSLSISSRVPAL